MKDENYDLIRTLQLSLEHVYRMETYISDAEQRGDSEFESWFRTIQTTTARRAIRASSCSWPA